MDPLFFSPKTITYVTTLSLAEIHRREESGLFPKRISLGPRRVAWVAEEVREWARKTTAEARKRAA